MNSRVALYWCIFSVYGGNTNNNNNNNNDDDDDDDNDDDDNNNNNDNNNNSNSNNNNSNNNSNSIFVSNQTESHIFLRSTFKLVEWFGSAHLPLVNEEVL